ncbi:MAG: hypothetical protein NTV92_01685 [Candidatus Bipolaricaulota bacterium]|nr:hypothetical protein [Candidatus Bipolaricaulota bacterium]
MNISCIAYGADQSLLEQCSDVAAAMAGPGAGNGRGGGAIKAMEGHQQADKQDEYANEAFDIERRETVHIAGHQPGAQHDEPNREDVDAPAEDGLQGVDPVTGESTFVGREEAEQGEQADDGQHRAEDVHFALGGDIAQERETFGRETMPGGGTPRLAGARRTAHRLRFRVGSAAPSGAGGTALRLRFPVRIAAPPGAGGWFFGRAFFREVNWHKIRRIDLVVPDSLYCFFYKLLN